MNHDYEATEFSRSVLAGVFAGIGATVVGLIYNFIFRGKTGFPLSDIINVSTIIFIALVLMTVAGLFFYLFHHYIKNGTLFYIVVSLLIVAAEIYFSNNVQRSSDPNLSSQFRELLIGVIIIFGVFSSFVVPYFYKSDKI